MRDIPWPSDAQDYMDEGSPCPEDGDFVYARPDAAETEEAINSSGICIQMWDPCTVYVHVYIQYVQVYAMYVHGLISCLNCHS